MIKAYETAGWNRLGKGWRIHFFLKEATTPICHNYGYGRSNSENFGTNFLRNLTDNMFCKSCAKKRKIPRDE